jgi:hypothetical protein
MSFGSQNSSGNDIENPYLRPENKKRKGSKFGIGSRGSKTSKRSMSSQKKNKFKSFFKAHDPFTKRQQFQPEGRQIELIADMRVSNALVIRKHAQRDSFVKRVLDDSYHDYGKNKKNKSPFMNEELEDMSFDDLELNQIEMTN